MKKIKIKIYFKKGIIILSTLFLIYQTINLNLDRIFLIPETKRNRIINLKENHQNRLSTERITQTTIQVNEKKSDMIDHQSLEKVVKVIDGDTVILESGKTVRYIGIDTPEVHHPKKKIQCFAKEAKEANEQLVLGKFVRLEKDVSETDRYGRLLRYVYVEDLFVNEHLLKEGFALLATFPPDVKYVDLLQKAQEEARKNNKGLYKNCLY